MKKALLLPILILLFSLSSFAQAYQEHDHKSYTPERVRRSQQLSVSVAPDIKYFTAGIKYTYEIPIADLSTTLVSGNIFFSQDYISLTDYMTPRIKLSVEPRYYYNLARRASKGRSTWDNSADFISFRAGYTFSEYYNFAHFAFYPAWGMRRVWGAFMLEANIGPILRVYLDGPVKFGWNAELSLGFVF